MTKEKIPPRPLFTGEWNQSHVGWFIWKFRDERKEIDAGTVQREFGKRNADKFTNSASNFRGLMKLIVKYQLARVTQDFSWSIHYKIKMVSSDYPYIEKVFDDEIFSHPLIAAPLSGGLDLNKTTIPILFDRFGFTFPAR